jgi:predicted N-acetyltransferase YhbS
VAFSLLTKENKVVGHILFTKINIKDDKRNSNKSLALPPIAVRHEHYYPKFGFELAEKWNIKAPFEVPTNIFMAIELISDGLLKQYDATGAGFIAIT